MYDTFKPLPNLNDSQLLSEQQKQIIKDEFYRHWKTCDNEMVQGEDLKAIAPSRKPIIFALRQTIKTTRIFRKSDRLENTYLERLLQELDLKCPTCGKSINRDSKVGKYIGNDEFWHGFNKVVELPSLSLDEGERKSQREKELDLGGIKLNYSGNRKKIDRKLSSTQTKKKEATKKAQITRQKKDFEKVVRGNEELKSHQPLTKNGIPKSAIHSQLGQGNSNGAIVACIDDNKTVQVQVKKTLEWAGYQVLNITDPGASISTLARCEPKLILMDINMPQFDGYELCQMLQKSRKLKNIPIVIFSSRNSIVDRLRAKMYGAVGYLNKPIAPIELIDFVNDLVPITPESLLKIYIQRVKGDE